MTRLFLLLITASVICFAADPFDGVWKIDLSQSPTHLPSDSQQTLEVTSNGITMTEDYTGLVTHQVHHRVTAVKFDGKFYPRVADAGPEMTCSGKRVDDRTIELFLKRPNGEPLEQVRMTISPDGKVLTETGWVVNDKKEKSEFKSVWLK